jgi:non-heme chloroperoxidase
MKKILENPIIGSIRKEFIEVEHNVRLHVTDGGEGRPVILIHGWPLSDEMFEYQYNELINSNFRVIGICLRGFGKSDKPFCAYNYDVLAKDIKMVLCKLDIQDAVLLGFSMGGSVAIRYVALDDGAHVSKLVLCGAVAPCWTQRPEFPLNLSVEAVNEFIELSQWDRPRMLTNFAAIFSASETSLNEGLKRWINEISINASAWATTQCLIALRDTDLREDLKKITLPTLIMHGKNDKICNFALAQKLNADIQNSQLVAFEHSGHSLFLEETRKFNNELVKFAKADIPQ